MILPLWCGADIEKCSGSVRNLLNLPDLKRGQRSSVNIEGKLVIVAQYTGPRLPEGTTVLPEGAAIEFKKIAIKCHRLPMAEMLQSLEEEHGVKPAFTESGETDMGGTPISGDIVCGEKTVGSWGPYYRETIVWIHGKKYYWD